MKIEQQIWNNRIIVLRASLENKCPTWPGPRWLSRQQNRILLTTNGHSLLFHLLSCFCWVAGLTDQTDLKREFKALLWSCRALGWKECTYLKTVQLSCFMLLIVAKRKRDHIVGPQAGHLKKPHTHTGYLTQYIHFPGESSDVQTVRFHTGW